jgi:hypothetical protein
VAHRPITTGTGTLWAAARPEHHRLAKPSDNILAVGLSVRPLTARLGSSEGLLFGNDTNVWKLEAGQLSLPTLRRHSG